MCIEGGNPVADQWQLALLKRSVQEWNAWREAQREIKVNLREADLTGAHLAGAHLSTAYIPGGAILSEVDLSRAQLRGVNFSEALLVGAILSEADLSRAQLMRAQLMRANLNKANLSGADLTDADLRMVVLNKAILNRTILSRADLRHADLRGADLTDANFSGADLTDAKQDASPPKSIKPEPHPGQSSSPDWLSLVETVGSTLLTAAVTASALIQGLDIVDRRWREHQAKRKPQTPQPTSASSTQPAASPSHKTHAPDKEIIEILLVMDDGSQHGFKRWVSNPDDLKAYIDAFSDPTSKVKPLQVVFRKREGRALVVDVTKEGKDNKPLNVILSYLDADPL
jgi:hypothetical protein